ncbi:reverse transcriptase [Gossypium australe]|uniref:Reverse transcriptase n=1 Tax=Gossypium australe TaxID=47621 RepID=A0A5B6WHS6_9ROSI|nr:reverse transcriptase [Gossypium australe]
MQCVRSVSGHGKIRGIRASQNGPRINHLFFVDDDLLFFCNKMEEVEIVRDTLHYFKTIFGQNINPSKSIVYFGPNTLRDQREQLSGI